VGSAGILPAGFGILPNPVSQRAAQGSRKVNVQLPSHPVTGSRNGLHPQRNFLAIGLMFMYRQRKSQPSFPRFLHKLSQGITYLRKQSWYRLLTTFRLRPKTQDRKKERL
jgi:hypothetical protein